ncbi:MAG: O-methyltransferase [Clostridia bacterium]
MKEQSITEQPITEKPLTKEHNAEQSVAEQLRIMHDFAREKFIPIMDDESVEKFVEIVRQVRPKRILEIGSAVGYSAALMAMNSDAQIDTIEIEKSRLDIAKSLWAGLGLSGRINAFLGDANTILRDVIADFGYDFVFLDGAKSKYLEQLQTCLPNVRSGGVIVADDVLFFGMVASGQPVAHKHRTTVTRLREFLEYISSNPLLDVTIDDSGNGMAIIKKK